MHDTFHGRVRDAGIAAWSTFLIAAIFFIAQWLFYLVVMSVQPTWVLTLWGPGATWPYVRSVWFDALIFLKISLWFLALGAMWLTLWARQLRQHAQRS